MSKETKIKNTKHIYCCHLDKKDILNLVDGTKGLRKRIKKIHLYPKVDQRNQMVLLNTWYVISHKWFRYLQAKYQKKEKNAFNEEF